MARWEPGAAERLQRAALDLFTGRGYEQTTAADIAAAAGLTERTFFRYFKDKPEVLFHGQEPFLAAFLSGLAAAPDGAGPIQLVRAALLSGTRAFDVERRPFARQRQAVIDAHPALQERERHKLAGLADAVSDALRARGVADLPATLAAESGATVFAVAFAQWLRGGDDRPLTAVVGEVLDELLSLAAPR